MPSERNDREVIATRNNRAVVASHNGALLISERGKPHPTIRIVPDRALSTIDLNAGDGATVHWDPGAGATGVSVDLPDLDDPITDLRRRSHRIGSYNLVGGHYEDSTATIVSRNASGEGEPASATLFRYRPVQITIATRSLGGFPQPDGNVIYEVAMDITISGRPFPQQILFSPEGSGPGGTLTSHQLQRFFDGVALDSQFRKSLTGGHAPILRRVGSHNELVHYTVTAISTLRGSEVSRAVHPFALQWN